MIDIAILAVAFVIILAGAELFTNGIEWFGRKLQLAEGAVGSVLAAVGTALPETMIPIIAIIFATGENSAAVGVGAILGAPFMLSTLAMFVTAIAVLVVARRRTTGDVMLVDTGVLAHDVRYFAIAYAIAIGAAFLPVEPVWLKWIVAVVLLGIYGWYVKAHFEADPEVDAEDLAPLRFRRLDVAAHRANPAVPRLRVVNLQVLTALALIVLGAIFFVDAVEDMAHQLNVDGALLALVIAPIATELPEKFNSVIWVRQNKDTLAMFVTAIAVLVVARRRTTGDVMLVDTGVLAHDVRYFAIAYAIAIGAAFLPVEPVWLKWIVAIVLLGIYGWYVKGHFEADPDVDAEDLAPLRFHRLDAAAHRENPAVPRLRVVNLQVLTALALIILGAVFFVDAVEDLAHQLNVDGALLALVIAPIATELPEKFNSVIWVRQGKDTLSMGNITGAMVFQSTIPTVVALVFASSTWVAAPGSYVAFASAGIAFLSMGAIFIPMVRRGSLRGRNLLVGGLFYLAYLALVLAVISGVVG
jgi:cation:H+ antiporter